MTKMTRKVSAAKTSPTTEKKVKKQPEPEPVIEEKVETPENSDIEEEVEAKDPITVNHEGILEMCTMMVKLAQKITQDTKKAEREYQSEKNRFTKAMNKKGGKEKKKRNGSTGLDKMQKINTPEFRQFIEKNYQQLNDKDGNQVITDLTYDDEDGSLKISRKQALKFVTAYVKHHELQQYEDKKRIKMDKTLQKLFPENVEKKDKSGKVIQEENFYFVSIMGALTPHLNAGTD